MNKPDPAYIMHHPLLSELRLRETVIV